jgi:hypothetical protein
MHPRCSFDFDATMSVIGMFVEPQLAHERGSGCQRDSAAAVHYKLLVGTEKAPQEVVGYLLLLAGSSVSVLANLALPR